MLALVETETVTAAARRVGVSRTTFYSWLGEKDFKAAVDNLRDQIYGEALGTLKGSMNEAVNVLRRLLRSKNMNARRIVAIQYAQLCLKAGELAGLEERLGRLEALFQVGEFFAGGRLLNTAGRGRVDRPS